MQTPEAIAAEIAKRLEDLPPADHRLLIAVAGPPASGKSTVAAELCNQLNAHGTRAGLVAMDGFHLDNAILDARGQRARKGAPETFDLSGFASLLSRLKAEDEVIVPRFSRDLDASIGSAIVISPEMTFAIVEGNYLLLDEPGWQALQPMWDFSAFLDVPEAELEARLTQRWHDHNLTPDEARAKIEDNDLPNARRVLTKSLAADYRVSL